MHAFNTTIMNQLYSNIHTLYSRRRMIARLEITPEEYIAAFVPEEARGLFRDITPWILHEKQTHRWELTIDGTPLNATVVMPLDSNKQAPLPPVPRNLALQPDAPEEVVERIHYWANRGGDTSREFGRVNKVLNMMNDGFSRNVIRYYWPTIIPLCGVHHATKGVAEELQELRVPARPKPLPSGLLKACRQTAETISAAQLIPTDVEPTESGNIRIDIAQGQHYTEPFGTFYGVS